MRNDYLNFKKEVIEKLLELVKKYLGRYTLAYGLTDADLLQFANEILEEKLQYDIENLVNRDPAAKAVSDSYSYVLNNYKGVQAIIYYRIANKLIYDDDFYDQINSNYQDELEVAPEEESVHVINKDVFYSLARKISEDAAILTTIEINPKAQIKKGLIIDHGVNVKIDAESTLEKRYDNLDSGIVIGEVCEIGENCCILNGVVLGATVVNEGQDDGLRRHPVIGNNVTICANAKVLGGVIIGNNVCISPGCIVKCDVPDNTNVTMINELQIHNCKDVNSSEKIVIYGLVPNGEFLQLYGENIIDAKVGITDINYEPIDDLALRIINNDGHLISFQIIIKNRSESLNKQVYISIMNEISVLYICNSLTLNKAISNLLNK